MLHSRRPPYRWLLKSPDYVYNLPWLGAYYPDARFVMTHRDPVKVIPSACSVIAEHTRQRLPDWTFDPDEFGHDVLVHLLSGMTRAIAAREAIGEHRFIDVGQLQLQGDPVGVAEQIYDFAGLDLSDDARAAMAQWGTDNRAGSRGQHQYSAEEFGLIVTGVDHMDMSADGTFLLASCETSGMAVKVDTRTMTITGSVRVGGLPLDVRLSPDGKFFFIANQGLSGVNVVDSKTLKVVRFIHTGTGAHGLGISRDTTKLYVTNRIAGTISVIDFATQKVIATWKAGASPDMVAFSADGSQMWVSNRYNGTVDVFDPKTGRIIKTIATGANPHGLMYWPQPGRYSLGHNGNMR